MVKPLTSNFRVITAGQPGAQIFLGPEKRHIAGSPKLFSIARNLKKIRQIFFFDFMGTFTNVHHCLCQKGADPIRSPIL